jgi:hypothetical protein
MCACGRILIAVAFTTVCGDFIPAWKFAISLMANSNWARANRFMADRSSPPMRFAANSRSQRSPAIQNARCTNAPGLRSRDQAAKECAGGSAVRRIRSRSRGARRRLLHGLADARLLFHGLTPRGWGWVTARGGQGGCLPQPTQYRPRSGGVADLKGLSRTEATGYHADRIKLGDGCA